MSAAHRHMTVKKQKRVFFFIEDSFVCFLPFCFAAAVKRAYTRGIKRQLYQVEQNIGARNGDTVEQPLVEKIAKHHCDTARKQRKHAAPKAGEASVFAGTQYKAGYKTHKEFCRQGGGGVYGVAGEQVGKGAA